MPAHPICIYFPFQSSSPLPSCLDASRFRHRPRKVGSSLPAGVSRSPRALLPCTHIHVSGHLPHLTLICLYNSVVDSSTWRRCRGKAENAVNWPDEKSLNCPIIALNSMRMGHTPYRFLICTGPCNIGYENYAGGWNTSSQLTDEQVAGRQGCFEQKRRGLDSAVL